MADFRNASLTCRNSELVIGLVYAVGTNVDAVEQALKSILSSKFQYDLNPIHLSQHLHRFLPGGDFSRRDARVLRKTLMDAGNHLRETAGPDALACLAASLIHATRQPGADGRPALRPRTAHIVRSLKRPEEVHTLRQIYGPGFYLVGVYASENERMEYMRSREKLSAESAKELIDRDLNENTELGQKTRSTYELADVFIHWKSEDQAARFLDLAFGESVVPPTLDEHAMFLAYAASLRSASLSRQVGASIVSTRGDTLAVGTNDVPRHGGGLYSDDGPNDQRDHRFRGGVDTNDLERNEIVKDIAQLIRKRLNIDEQAAPDLEELIRKSKLRNVMEFGRAVHAEMDALLACARQGVSPRGGTLYSTTFPCHNCAKHIVAAGIERVVFIEAYPKSRATDLHGDSIELKDERGGKEARSTKVHFEPFVGVGPRRYFDLFSTKLSWGWEIERKENGMVTQRDPSLGPRVEMLPNSYLDREAQATAHLHAIFPPPAP